jgi:pyruvate/2-oxoglutarate/acetoin dehydrogenase E1 component
MVIQTFAGARGHGAYAHSQSTQAIFLDAPGIKMVIPSTPADAKGLLASAIRDDSPVLIFHLRSIIPLDEELIASSMKKTIRLVIVEDGLKRGGIGSEVVAMVSEKYFDLLDAPIMRVAALNTAVPFSAPLEKAHFPQVENIVSAVKKTLE